MSEFKIKVSVELDSSDLESKLNALGKDQKIKRGFAVAQRANKT